MTVQDKTKETSFFLSKLQATDYRSNEKLHYLFAFLASARGILENVILYDYASKYGLPMTLNDYLNAQAFRSAATGNSLALNFIQWYDQTVINLRSNPYWTALGEKRNIVFHRGTPGLQHNIGVFEGISVYATVVAKDSSGNITGMTSDAPTHMQRNRRACLSKRHIEDLPR